MKKRLLSVLLAAMMCVSLLAGCGSGDDGSTGNNNSNTGNSNTGSGGGSSDDAGGTEDPFAEHLDITVWLQADDNQLYSSYDDNPIVTYLNEKFNMTLKFQQPAMGSESEQFNLMIGTGEYTDAFWTAYSQDNFETLYEQKVIQDLTPYESYLPNYIAYLNKEGNEQVKDVVYKDGKLLAIGLIDAVPGDQWGGLVYRRDILETMTGGNVAFPSGNAEPTTVEDWEYMLELMKQYFEAAGFQDYACLILPSSGYIGTSGAQVVGGFGTSGSYHIEDGKVVFGPVSEKFYNYLVKMNEWYEKGYIYKDFASRTQDIFYLPNTALTYGGSAGIWYGLSAQLGDAMSMPEYGLYFDVHAIANPLDTEHGITGADASFVFDTGRAGQHASYAISTNCSEDKLIRFLQAMDYMYTEEGGYTKTIGLNAEQAAGNAIYAQAGYENGTYALNSDGTFDFSSGWDNTADGAGDFVGLRLPGIYRNDILREYFTPDINKEAEAIWTQYGRDKVYPFSLSPSAEQNEITSRLYTQIFDYINSEVPQFIMGTKPINEETFKTFVDQIYAYGLDEYISIYQSMYDDYLAKYGD